MTSSNKEVDPATGEDLRSIHNYFIPSYRNGSLAKTDAPGVGGGQEG